MGNVAQIRATMYSRKFDTIFIHIPKTAGRSIEQVFLERSGLTGDDRAELLMRENHEPQGGPRRLAHLYGREYTECGHVAPADFARAFKFTVVRNPYDRVVSEYCWRYPRRRQSFGAFVKSLTDHADEHSDASRHIAQQFRFVLDAEDRLIPDAVLRFESLVQDFAAISLRLFGEIVALPHLNPSAVTERPAISGKLQRKIYRHYERDFDLFRYPARAASA